MKIEGKKVCFLGDSITAGNCTTCMDKRFHQIIAKKYNLAYAIPYGVPGTRIARQTVPTVHETPSDLTYEIRAEIMPRDAEVIVVFGGTNDYGYGDAVFGNVDDINDDNIYSFCGGLNSLMNRLERDFPNAQKIFLTPIHRKDENSPSRPEGKILADYAAAIKSICEKRGYPVIDLFSINPIDAWDGALMPDGLHPNDAGHAILAEVIATEIERL
ncbi:MAG: SGNH/GDSL hydrolase family protein [Clostridia bacterium]|nr:SGNH/GDSL hydrolase family protein [Clostridia bacterium]